MHNILYKKMSNEVVDTTTLGNSSPRVLGRVKWFNNKAGYGFITVSNGDQSGTDMFVHHSGILVLSEQYKYLVQGEYVEFIVGKTDGGAHEYHAGDVSGINGGKLMCETRKDFRQMRSNYKDEESDVPTRTPRGDQRTTSSSRVPYVAREPQTPRGPRTSQSPRVQQEQRQDKDQTPRARGPGPRDGAEWTLVKKGSKPQTDAKKTMKPRSKAPPTTQDATQVNASV
jgi:cold shock CspA family protein